MQNYLNFRKVKKLFLNFYCNYFKNFEQKKNNNFSKDIGNNKDRKKGKLFPLKRK